MSGVFRSLQQLPKPDQTAKTTKQDSPSATCTQDSPSATSTAEIQTTSAQTAALLCSCPNHKASLCRHLPPFRHFAYPQKTVTGILQQIARVCGHLASISVWRWLVQNSRACARCLRSCSCLCERMISVFVQHRHAGGPRVTHRCSLRGVSRTLTPKTAGSMRSANMLCSDAAYASARF